MKIEERLARMETNIEWIVEALRKHVDAPSCANCKHDQTVKTNRKLIWFTWVGIAGAYLKGFIANVFA